MTPVILTVTQVNKYIKSVFDADLNLQSVFISGEISNFVNHRSGHYYLTLKDDGAEIKSVMFRSANAKLKFLPENGMKVVCKGRISVYETSGAYQLYIDNMIPDGSGALNLAFEQLKERLEKEGLFDAAHKKPVPEYPKKVGVITSPTGAAVQDIKNVLSRRYPLAEMIFYPALVQGDGAADDIVNAIKYFNKFNLAEVLIVGRGGGSREDLWAFNEEALARSIYESDIPVISAVGHETDFTICDFVADLRAPTPSAAAELAVPDISTELRRLNNQKSLLLNLSLSYTDNLKIKLSVLNNQLEKRSPQTFVNDYRVRCDKAEIKIENSAAAFLLESRKNFSAVCAKLDALSPLKILSRGFAAVSKNGEAVISATKLVKGDKINVVFSDGKINCTVD
ncbi:MAG: exodeoxyribonuclease VII large subunit [Clostridia bacterium]|nr:exodeoxyribonuclease VII large subunit [Clostridia bacterium]